MNVLSLIIPIATGAIGNAAYDMNRFVIARRKDPSVKFDLVLCAASLAYGAMSGFLTWAGMSAAGVVK